MIGDTLVYCTVGDDAYALRSTDVRQIVRVERMRECGATDGRVGTIDMAGSTAPVFPLGRALGHATRPAPPGHHVVLTGGDDDLIGWLVDRVERTPIDDETVVAPLPPMVGARALRWFTAIVRTADRSVLLMAPRGANTFARANSQVCDTSANATARVSTDRPPAPILVFATKALPHAEVSRFALSCRRVVAVAQDVALTVVPGSNHHVAGLAWWRDAVMPVINFRGRSTSEGAMRRRCLVARGSERLGAAYIGLPVDSDIAMHQPRTEDLQAADVACPPFAVGVFDVGGSQPVALLNLDALFSLKEES